MADADPMDDESIVFEVLVLCFFGAVALACTATGTLDVVQAVLDVGVVSLEYTLVGSEPPCPAVGSCLELVVGRVLASIGCSCCWEVCRTVLVLGVLGGWPVTAGDAQHCPKSVFVSWACCLPSPCHFPNSLSFHSLVDFCGGLFSW